MARRCTKHTPAPIKEPVKLKACQASENFRYAALVKHLVSASGARHATGNNGFMPVKY